MFKRILFVFMSLMLMISISIAQETKQEEKVVDEVALPVPVYVEIVTNKGNIKLELDPEKAPNTVGNFIQYVVDKHYDGLIFHRIIPGFMVQGGGLDEKLVPRKTRTPIDIESNNGLKNVKGSVAMARTSDPNSATSQFFINTVDNGFLDFPGADGYGYTVFGKVIDGMDVVEAIEKVKTTSFGWNQDVPIDPVIIEKVTLIAKPEATKEVEGAKKQDEVKTKETKAKK